MASSLFEALMANQYTPQESPFGIGAGAIASAAPALYNPYASTGSNAMYGVGAGLLAGLLGGLAKRQARQENADLYKQAFALRSAKPEEVSAIIGENPRLAPFGIALQEQRDQRAAEIADLQLKSNIELNKDLELERLKGTNAANLEQNKQLGEYGLIKGPDGKVSPLVEALGVPKGEDDSLPLPLKEQRAYEQEATKILTTGAQANKALEMNKAAENIYNSLQQDNPLAASTAIFEFAKLQDPTGTVREGDELRVSDPGGPLGQLARLHNEIMQKGKLTPDAKVAMATLVPQLQASTFAGYNQLKDNYVAQAKRYKANPGNIQFIKPYVWPSAEDVQNKTIAGGLLTKEQFKEELLKGKVPLPPGAKALPKGDQEQLRKGVPTSNFGVPFG